MPSNFINPVLWKRQRRPTSLLVVAGLLVFLVVFDQMAILGNLPFIKNPAAAAGLILLGLFALKRLKYFRLRQGPQLWAVAFLLSTFVIQCLRFAETGDFALPNYMQWVQPLILFIILTDLCKDPRALAYLWLGFLGAVGFMALTGVMGFEALTGGSSGQLGTRSGFEGANLNNQAYWYGLGLVTLAWILIERWPRLRKGEVLIVAGAALLAIALLKTGSRGGVLAAVIGISVMLALSLRKRNFSAFVSLVPLLAGASFWLVATSEVVVNRFGALLAGDDDGGRMSIWGPALELVTEHPWLGVGPEFAELLGAARENATGRNISSHNSYLQVALAFGIPALMLWLTLIGSVLLRCWRAQKNPIGALLFALAVSSLAYGISADLSFNKYFWVLLAIASQVHIYAAVLQPGLRNWDWKAMLGIRRRPGRKSFSRSGPLLR